MDNLQSNLNQQPQQSQPPTPQQPPSNKLWPINWRHNTILKIIGLICLLAFSFLLLLLTKRGEAWVGIYIFAYRTIIIGAPLGIISIIISIIRLKKLDKTDKFFMLISFLFLIIGLCTILFHSAIFTNW
jgi:hypothetical protein